MKKLQLFLLLSALILINSSCKASKNDKNELNTEGKTSTSGTAQNEKEQNDLPVIVAGDYKEDAPSPEFSKESGFYDEPFELFLTAPEGYRIFYTLDGSLPTSKSTEIKATEVISVYDRSEEPNVYAMMEGTTTGAFYAPTILIDKATILRAVAFDADGTYGRVITKSYFLDYQDKSDYYGGVAVLSMVTDPVNLFDYNTGIYVTGATFDDWRSGKQYDSKTRYWHQPANYKNGSEEWERPAHIDFFEDNGVLAFSEDIGIRMHGGASRAFLQKSFNFYARSKYGSKNIKYELFPNLQSEYDLDVIKKFDSLMLRNGGNDTELTKIREVMHHNLASELDISVQAARPVIVFLNGEYWGLYQLQEKYSEDYIESHYGVDKENVVIIKKDEVDEGEETDIELYNSMMDFVTSKDLSDSALYDEFCTMMDIESLIDYTSMEIFVGNKDWGSNNVMLWRSRTANAAGENPFEDGRWRFMMYDTEYSTGLSYENSLAFDANYNPSFVTDDNFQTVFNPNSTMGKMFTGLMKNSTFVEQFKTRFMQIANDTLNQDKVLPLLDAYATMYRPMMADTLLRFRDITEEQAIKQFDYEVDKIRNYYSMRHDIIIGKLNSYFQ